MDVRINNLNEKLTKLKAKLSLSDDEYAACIFSKVVGYKNLGNTLNVRGVLESIDRLHYQESRALHFKYRLGMTYEETGSNFGIDKGKTRVLIKRALRNLSRILQANYLNTPVVVKNLNNQLEVKNDIIKESQNKMGMFKQYAPISQEPYGTIRIDEMGFSKRTYNVLNRAGLHYIEMILAIDDHYEIKKMRNCGNGTFSEIIAKMREYGYVDWADKMDVDNPQVEISKIGFSTRTFNVLYQAGLHEIDMILELEDFDELLKLPGVGKFILSEILTRMREYGYVDWASRLETYITI